MSIGPRLDLRTSQTLVISPQLQAAIKLLTLSNLELMTEISAEMDRNPLLEMAEEGDGGIPDAPAEAEGAPLQIRERRDLAGGPGGRRTARSERQRDGDQDDERPRHAELDQKLDRLAVGMQDGPAFERRGLVVGKYDGKSAGTDSPHGMIPPRDERVGSNTAQQTTLVPIPQSLLLSPLAGPMSALNQARNESTFASVRV